jgi:hypothetical protein
MTLFADPVAERLNKAMTADIGKVGPHGYVHGWIKVGNEADNLKNTVDAMNASGKGSRHLKEASQHLAKAKKAMAKGQGRAAFNHVANAADSIENHIGAHTQRTGDTAKLQQASNNLYDHTWNMYRPDKPLTGDVNSPEHVDAQYEADRAASKPQPLPGWPNFIG